MVKFAKVVALIVLVFQVSSCSNAIRTDSVLVDKQSKFGLILNVNEKLEYLFVGFTIFNRKQFEYSVDFGFEESLEEKFSRYIDSNNVSYIVSLGSNEFNGDYLSYNEDSAVDYLVVIRDGEICGTSSCDVSMKGKGILDGSMVGWSWAGVSYEMIVFDVVARKEIFKREISVHETVKKFPKDKKDIDKKILGYKETFLCLSDQVLLRFINHVQFTTSVFINAPLPMLRERDGYSGDILNGCNS